MIGPAQCAQKTPQLFSRDRHQTQDEMVWAVKKYIHFYNTERIHSSISSVSPNQCEQVFLKQA
ncbi:MAG: IS3 family transposase [Methylovulum sp.]|uniref:IS3 family transposase n=1 Tax=Methylovulum sp. TaxID=1916980 RepID=UPI002608CE09|nr:IS3 family transposase [Methylovulum sp.]MDD2723230.1 IS3 family transposase [Methylovulum sp.]